VPTWSYLIVHVYGKPRLITDETELGEHLVKLVERYENQTSYDLTKVPAATMGKLTRGVVGFKIAVTRFEASFKLNQNRNRQSYQNIIAELEKRTDEGSHKIAKAMKSVEPDFR
jgi:transcriptional regulator